MTNNQDALRCAETLERDVCDLHDPRESAAHIRRLVAENEAKDSLLRQALGALEFHQEQTRPIHRTQNIIATIKQHLGQKGETG